MLYVLYSKPSDFNIQFKELEAQLPQINNFEFENENESKMESNLINIKEIMSELNDYMDKK